MGYGSPRALFFTALEDSLLTFREGFGGRRERAVRVLFWFVREVVRDSSLFGIVLDEQRRLVDEEFGLLKRDHYTVSDPYDRRDAPTSRPTFGLDAGETDGIVLANALEVDGFLTDEFGGTNFALVHAALQGPRIVPTPRLVCDYARNDHMSTEQAQSVVTTIGEHRSWTGSPYVSQLLAQLD